MKSISTALAAILASNQFWMADCYTFTLQSNAVVRYTSADQGITDAATGNVFPANGPYFERSKIKFERGVAVDEMDVTVTAKPTDLLDGEPFLAALVSGILDGAEVQLDRAYMPAFGDTSAGLLTLFTGRVAEVQVGRTQATIKANTHLELLNLQWPWRVFEPGCCRALYDSGCTLSQAAFGQAATVGSGSTVQNIVTTLSKGAGWSALGLMTFTSGELAGQTFGIQTDDGAGNLGPSTPVPVAPASGDTLTIYPGCDKQQSTCQTKFNNLPNFEGFPYIPAPETAV